MWIFHPILFNSLELILFISLGELFKKVKAAFDFVISNVAPLVTDILQSEPVEVEQRCENQVDALNFETLIGEAVPNLQLQGILVCDECGKQEMLAKRRRITHGAPRG